MNPSSGWLWLWGQWLIERPMLLLGLAAAPLWWTAWRRRAYPSRLGALIAVGLACFSILTLVWPLAVSILVILDALLFVVLIADFFTLPPASWFYVERESQRVVSLQNRHAVTINLNYVGKRPLSIRLRDDVPDGFAAEPPEFELDLPRRSRTTVDYELKALRRGAFLMESVFLRVPSRWGLWSTILVLPCRTDLHVYPDLRQLQQYSLLARTNRLGQMGVRRVRRIGQDHEFERLRDYTPDDNFRHIDWRSTARRNKLTVKDFQTSQNQRVLFLIDCGRMMTNRSSGLSLLDHSLNASLMLSYVALRQGDSVGMMLFADRVRAFVAPRSGMSQMNRLIHASFDQFPQMVESRYDLAFLHLANACRRRALVVLITNVIDEVNAGQIQGYLKSSMQRHVALGLLLRDRALYDRARLADHDDGHLFTTAAACEILSWRHQVVRDLQHSGVLVLDCFPEAMTAPLINRYLELKARHVL